MKMLDHLAGEQAILDDAAEPLTFLGYPRGTRVLLSCRVSWHVVAKQGSVQDPNDQIATYELYLSSQSLPGPDPALAPPATTSSLTVVCSFQTEPRREVTANSLRIWSDAWRPLNASWGKSQVLRILQVCESTPDVHGLNLRVSVRLLCFWSQGTRCSGSQAPPRPCRS